MADPALYRVYGQAELGPDGYPFAWHETIKHEVRAAAEDRCVRCRHPYTVGASDRGEWSPCDERCVHGGPFRWRTAEGHSVFEDEGLARALIYDHGVRVEAHWRILTVHHLNEVKADCRWWNLVALCQRCHLLIQRKVKLDRPWPWEHKPWFRPYVAGYYASAILGEELSREETRARLDELLALAGPSPALW